jgi:hypothetical protein
METNIFTKKDFWEQKKILFSHILKKLGIFNCFKKTGLYLEKIKILNKNTKEEYYNINLEKVYSKNKKDFDSTYDKYKSDLSIITDGFCS